MLFRSTSLALFTALTIATPTAFATPDSTATVEVSRVPATAPAKPVAAGSHDTARYAQREEQSKPAADFKGGSLIVVGISGTAVLVVLLALLLL